MKTASSPDKGTSRKRTFVYALVALATGAGIGFLVGALVVNGDEEERQVTRLPVLDTTLQRIVAGPEPFFGDSVVVGGEVREIISPRAFTVGQPGFFGPDLLVVTKAPLAAPTGRSGSRPVLEGDSVTVAGDVQRFDVAGFERFAGVELTRELDSFVGDDLAEREGDPALRAQTVAFNSRKTPVVEAASGEEVIERPRDFYGKVAAVTGEVTDVLGSGALIVDDRLVALTADFAQREPAEGDRVRIVGPVRPFDPDQLRRGGRGLVDDDVLGNLANRPAIVAQSLEIER
jgi:hypothetical protein